MDFSWLANPIYTGYLWQGFINTILLVAVAGTCGFALAVVFALAQASGPRPVAWATRGFCTVIRGTPLLLQLFFFYNGVGLMLAHMPAVRESFAWPLLRGAFFYGALTFTISVGAYVGEVIRGAMLSVPKGELEAAHAFGLSRFQTLRRVWLPRSVQICLPTLTNEAILLLKSTPLVSTIAVMDLLGAANNIRDATLSVYPPLLIVVGIYLAIAAIMALFTGLVERNFPGKRSQDDKRRTTHLGKLISGKLGNCR